MLYESYFENKTRGAVVGSSILSSDLPNGAGKLYDPKSKQFRTWNKKELYFDNNLFDVREVCKNLQTSGFKTWKIEIRSRETKEIIWVRPFISRDEAIVVWAHLINADLERIEQGTDVVKLPGFWTDGDLEYQFATVQTYTSGSGNWTAPDWTTTVQYLVVAGGGSGGIAGSQFSGGGGAGGYRANVPGENSGGGASAEATFNVTPGTSYAYSVGGSSGNNGSGNNSSFSNITSTGGGRGGYNGAANAVSGGSGGGGQENGSGASGTANQGYAGGNGSSNNGGGGGGGASQTGAARGQAYGGNGVTSAISGSSVTRGGGGGGAYRNYQGPGGSGGGANGASNNTGANSATANTGGGGGGSANSSNGTVGASGIVILSYTPIVILNFNMPNLGM